MPREGSAEVYRHLGRYQACHRCRKRKLKCDGSLPCESCRRAHAYELKTRPATAAAEPKCEYDHPDIVAEGPKGRIARLESRIAELQAQLGFANARLSRCRCGGSAGDVDFSSLSDHPSSRIVPVSAVPNSSRDPLISAATRTRTTRNALPTMGQSMPAPPPIEAFLLPPSPWNTESPPLPIFSPGLVRLEEIDAETFDILPSPWPLNIPPPAVLDHLVPASPEFPHVALLHAICGLASIYSPIIDDRRKEPDGAHLSSFNSAIVFRPQAETGAGARKKHYFPRTLEDVMDEAGEEGFGASHIRWAAASLRLSVQKGDRLLQLLQAAIICTWYTYSTGLTINVYTWLGTVNRFVSPLGVYASEGFEPLSRLPPNMLFLFGRPKTPIEAETVRNVFWVTYVMERIYNAGNAWPLTISDEDISQTMPCRLSDFEAAEPVPSQSRQRLFTVNMLLTHPPLTTDAWTLYIKATILISRVRSFNCRYRIVSSSSERGYPERTEADLKESEEFRHLDQTIGAFVGGMPRAFREPVGATVDPVLYMAHLLPHVAMIQLHDPHAKLDSPNDHSTGRMLTAARAILELIYKVCGTTFDLRYMDHGCSFCWFVAGAAVIRFLKVKMDAKDQEEVFRLEQELGVVKFVLKNLGERTSIGLRQIKLLDEIYRLEINGCGLQRANVARLMQRCC